MTYPKTIALELGIRYLLALRLTTKYMNVRKLKNDGFAGISHWRHFIGKTRTRLSGKAH